MAEDRNNHITGARSPEPNTEEGAVLGELIANRELFKDAYTSIDELRQYTPQDVKRMIGLLPQESQNALAQFGNLDILHENSAGDRYLVNDKDELTEFHYANGHGMPEQSFHDIQYKNGQVENFTLNGDRWTRGDSAWTNQKGESLNLGTVSFDQSGLNATGSDGGRFLVPERNYQTEAGDQYQLNANGKMSGYSYRDQEGNEVHGYRNIEYGTDGKVSSFTATDGRQYHRIGTIRRDIVDDGVEDYWVRENDVTGRKPRYQLGEVTVDEQGLHATGPDAISHIYQPMVIATGRESILAEARELIRRRSPWKL